LWTTWKSDYGKLRGKTNNLPPTFHGLYKLFLVNLGIVFFFGLLLDVERFLKNCRQVSQSKLGEEQAALQNLQSENAELHRRLEVQTNIIQISYNSFFPQSFS